MQHHLTILVSKLTAHYTAAATSEDMTKTEKNHSPEQEKNTKI